MGTNRIQSGQGELSRDMPEVADGTRAFHFGCMVDDCPYPIGDDRRQPWLTGWYDARTRARLGRVFARWKLDWP